MSIEIRRDKTLINFYIEDVTKNMFDSVCKAYGKTRTQVLAELMVEHIIKSLPALKIRHDKLREANEVLAAMVSYDAHPDNVVENHDMRAPLAVFWSDENEEVLNF